MVIHVGQLLRGQITRLLFVALSSFVIGYNLGASTQTVPSVQPDSLQTAPQVPSQYPRPTSKLCNDEGQGSLWRTSQEGKILHISGERYEVYDVFSSRETVYFTDSKGVDWTVFKKCHAAVLFYGSDTGSIKKVWLTFPVFFDVLNLYNAPWMGARRVGVRITGNGLSVSVPQS